MNLRPSFNSQILYIILEKISNFILSNYKFIMEYKEKQFSSFKDLFIILLSINKKDHIERVLKLGCIDQSGDPILSLKFDIYFH